jgi:hypothetical protein
MISSAPLPRSASMSRRCTSRANPAHLRCSRSPPAAAARFRGAKERVSGLRLNHIRPHARIHGLAPFVHHPPFRQWPSGADLNSMQPIAGKFPANSTNNSLGQPSAAWKGHATSPARREAVTRRAESVRDGHLRCVAPGRRAMELQWISLDFDCPKPTGRPVGGTPSARAREGSGETVALARLWFTSRAPPHRAQVRKR